MLLQVLITIGIAQALSLSALLLLKPRRGQADYLLVINLLVLFSTTILFNYKDELDSVMPGIGMFSLALGFLALPLFYLYVVAASRGGLQSIRNLLWVHLLPFAGITLLFINQFYSLSAEDRLALICSTGAGALMKMWWQQLAIYSLFLVIFPLYIFLSFRVLRQHEAYILTRFSYTEEVGLGWLNRFLWGVIVMWVAFLLFEVVGSVWLGIVDPLVGYMPGFIAIVGTVVYLGVYGWRYRIFALEEEEELEAKVSEQLTEERYSGSGLSETQKLLILQQLQTYMDAEKPYLEARVTIGQLAAQLEIPVNYLSQVINEKLDQNFFEFINSYRVQEFQRLLDDPANEQYTLLSLAYEAGFNSKSTFNSIFKKLTGYTPSEYVRMHSVPGIT